MTTRAQPDVRITTVTAIFVTASAAPHFPDRCERMGRALAAGLLEKLLAVPVYIPDLHELTPSPKSAFRPLPELTVQVRNEVGWISVRINNEQAPHGSRDGDVE